MKNSTKNLNYISPAIKKIEGIIHRNLNYVNSNIKPVMFDQDLTLIENPQKRLILELKRTVQDCVSTIECEGAQERYINELNHYVNLVIDELNKY